MLRDILLFLLILIGNEIVAQSHDTLSNDLILSNLLKDGGANNNCDILMLPRDQEECAKAQRELAQDNPCFLEFGNEILGHVEVNLTHISVIYALKQLQILFQNSKAVMITATLKEDVIARSNCPILVLPTAQNKRLSQVLSVVEETRMQINLAVVTKSNLVKEVFLNRTERVTFDVQLFFLNGTETEYIYNPVKENKAWNYVTVSHV